MTRKQTRSQPKAGDDTLVPAASVRPAANEQGQAADRHRRRANVAGAVRRTVVAFPELDASRRARLERNITIRGRSIPVSGATDDELKSVLQYRFASPEDVNLALVTLKRRGFGGH